MKSSASEPGLTSTRKKELFSLVIYLYLKDGALTAVKRYAVS